MNSDTTDSLWARFKRAISVLIGKGDVSRVVGEKIEERIATAEREMAFAKEQYADARKSVEAYDREYQKAKANKKVSKGEVTAALNDLLRAEKIAIGSWKDYEQADMDLNDLLLLQTTGKTTRKPILGKEDLYALEKRAALHREELSGLEQSRRYAHEVVYGDPVARETVLGLNEPSSNQEIDPALEVARHAPQPTAEPKREKPTLEG